MLFSMFNEKGLCILIAHCLTFLGFGPYVPDRGIYHIIHVFECRLQNYPEYTWKSKTTAFGKCASKHNLSATESRTPESCRSQNTIAHMLSRPGRHMKSFTLNKKPEHFTCFKISQQGEEE